MRKTDEAASAFNLHGLAGNADRKRGIEPAGPARRLDYRDPDPLGHGRAQARISGGGDRDAGAGKAENPWIVLPACQIARAFARGVADVAEDEQIAKSGAGKAGKIGRFAGP